MCGGWCGSCLEDPGGPQQSVCPSLEKSHQRPSGLGGISHRTPESFSRGFRVAFPEGVPVRSRRSPGHAWREKAPYPRPLHPPHDRTPSCRTQDTDLGPTVSSGSSSRTHRRGCRAAWTRHSLKRSATARRGSVLVPVGPGFAALRTALGPEQAFEAPVPPAPWAGLGGAAESTTLSPRCPLSPPHAGRAVGG